MFERSVLTTRDGRLFRGQRLQDSTHPDIIANRALRGYPEFAQEKLADAIRGIRSTRSVPEAIPEQPCVLAQQVLPGHSRFAQSRLVAAISDLRSTRSSI